MQAHHVKGQMMSACAIVGDVKETLKVTVVRRVTSCLKPRLETGFLLRSNVPRHVSWTAQRFVGRSWDVVPLPPPTPVWLPECQGTEADRHSPCFPRGLCLEGEAADT